MKRKCPSCGGGDLVHGETKKGRGFAIHKFFPESSWRLWGYPLRAFVCLDCGFLGHYLAKSSLAEIRETAENR